MHHCKPLIQDLVKLWLFSISQCRLKTSCTFTRCHKQFQLVFLFISQTVRNPVLYDSVTSLWFPSSSRFLIIWSFWEILKATCFILPGVPCSFIFGSFEAITIGKWTQKGPNNRKKGHRISIHNRNYRWWNFQSWGYPPQVPDYQECHIKGILL